MVAIHSRHVVTTDPTRYELHYDVVMDFIQALPVDIVENMIDGMIGYCNCGHDPFFH